MDLIDAVYESVRAFPKSELFLLSQQMRSAAISIASNIAEGRGRYTPADQVRFYVHARGSTSELETQIEIAIRQQFISRDVGEQLLRGAEEVGRLISGLIKPKSKTQGLGPKA